MPNLPQLIDKNRTTAIKHTKLRQNLFDPTKKAAPPFGDTAFLILKMIFSYASATTSFTETKERFSLPLRKVTTPSTNAYNV